MKAYMSDLQQFLVCYLWPLLIPPVAVLQYVMYFWFYG